MWSFYVFVFIRSIWAGSMVDHWLNDASSKDVVLPPRVVAHPMIEGLLTV
jgi:hypothetical protein